MKSLTILRLAISLLVLTPSAQAQITTKKSLTLDGAKQVIAAAVAEAKRPG